jgi:hypothetical protein
MTTRINDDDDLVFGDSSEFVVEYDEDSTDNLIIVAANANDAVQVGDGTTATDMKMMAVADGGGTDNVLWDSSDDDLKFVGSQIVLDSDSGIEVPVMVVTTGTFTVDANDTGRVHVIPDLAGNTTIDLPAEASGLYYKFIYVGAADEAHDHTIDTEAAGNNFIGGVAFADTDAGDAADEINAGIYSNGSTNSKLTINNASAGTVIELYCDGTEWYVLGIVFSDTAPAFADQS